MTNNEAIGILAIVVETAKGRCFVTDEAISDAYAMAIKALEAQELSKNSPKLDKENGDLQPTCNHLATDTISRQEVIDALTALEEPAPTARHLSAIYDCEDAIKALPPAQPEPIHINLNEPIKVKLTDWGKEIYYHQYDRTNQTAGREICKPRFPRGDENGYTEFQLWCFMELYGEHIGMTLPNVIEPLEIVYER